MLHTQRAQASGDALRAFLFGSKDLLLGSWTTTKTVICKHFITWTSSAPFWKDPVYLLESLAVRDGVPVLVLPWRGASLCCCLLGCSYKE